MDKILLNKIGRKLKDFQEELQNAIDEQPETSCEQLNAEWEKLMEENNTAKTKNKGWINIYRTKRGDSYTHDAIWCNEELAKEFGRVDKDYITTIKIEWEEEV